MASAPTFAQLAPTVAARLSDCALTGHTVARFDRRVLTAESGRVGFAAPTVGARVIDADARFVRQVRAPAGRLRLPRQIGDELVPGVEQFPLVDDVVAVEDGAALVAETASVRRQAPRNVASILDSARELGIRDAQGVSQATMTKTR